MHRLSTKVIICSIVLTISAIVSSCYKEPTDPESTKTTQAASYLRMLPISSSAIRLEWYRAKIRYEGGMQNYSIGPQKEIIERAVSGKPFMLVGSITGDSTIFVDSNLDTTCSYQYRIRSVFSDSSLVYSEDIQIRYGDSFPFQYSIPSASYSDFHPNGRQIVSLRANIIYLWDAQTGTIIKQFRSAPAYQGTSFRLAINPSGEMIAAVGDYYDSSSKSLRGEINVLRVNDGTLITRYHNQSLVSSAVFDKENEIISGGFKPSLVYWTANTGGIIKELNPDSIYAYRLAISPDLSTLAVASSSNPLIRLINIGTGEIIRTLSGHGDHTYVIAFSRDGKYLATDASDNGVALWRIADGQLVRIMKTSSADNLTSVCFNGDNSFIICGYESGRIRLWSSSSGAIYRSLTAHTQNVNSIAVDKIGLKMLSCSSDQVSIWSLQSTSGWYVEE